MAARLTDRKKKKIIADYIELGSYNATAKENGVTRQTVKNIVSNDTEFGQKLHLKKEENTTDILAHMETKKDKVNQIIDVYLDKLLDPEMLAGATPNQITTALGTIIDKFTMANIPTSSQKEEHSSIVNAIKKRNANNNINRETNSDT